MSLKFGSVCSGIEAASQAWDQLGWQAVWLSEIDTFPSALLAHHYPTTPNLGDMGQIPNLLRVGKIEAPDVLVGGTPCQSFSVAGLRKGIADARGALTLCFIEIANEIDTIRARKGQQPSIIVWENVPGVLSDKGNAFGCFLAGLAGSDCELQPTGKRWTNAGVVFGPQRTVAWRILDAQYWGLAQRRKRVFVIASARAAFDPTQILFERDGLRRNPAPFRGAQQAVAATLEASIGRGRGAGTSTAVLVPDLSTFRKLSHGEFCEDQVSSTLLASGAKEAADLVCCVHGTQDPLVNGDIAFPLGRNNGQENVIAYSYGIAGNIIGRSPKNGGNGTGYCEDLGYTLTKTDQHGVAYAAFVQNSRDEVRYVGGDGAIVGALAASAGAKQQNYLLEKTDCLNLEQPQCWRVYSENGLAPTLQAGESRGNIILTVRLAVRRLMPVECERLQGFPDDYTQIPYRNKTEAECSDSPRYKALGNSMAVPVMAWLGLKIQNYLDRLSAQECAA